MPKSTIIQLRITNCKTYLFEKYYFKLQLYSKNYFLLNIFEFTQFFLDSFDMKCILEFFASWSLCKLHTLQKYMFVLKLTYLLSMSVAYTTNKSHRYLLCSGDCIYRRNISSRLGRYKGMQIQSIDQSQTMFFRSL